MERKLDTKHDTEFECNRKVRHSFKVADNSDSTNIILHYFTITSDPKMDEVLSQVPKRLIHSILLKQSFIKYSLMSIYHITRTPAGNGSSNFIIVDYLPS